MVSPCPLARANGTWSSAATNKVPGERDDAVSLEADPACAAAGDRGGCRRAIADGEVGEGGGVEDYRRGLRRDFGHERGEAAAQVTALDAHPGRGREGQRAGEPAAAVLVFGPDEGF